MGEEFDAAATRAWAAGECLKKAGAAIDAPLILARTAAEGWVFLDSGPHRIGTFIAQLRGATNRLALAVLAESRDASLRVQACRGV